MPFAVECTTWNNEVESMSTREIERLVAENKKQQKYDDELLL